MTMRKASAWLSVVLVVLAVVGCDEDKSTTGQKSTSGAKQVDSSKVPLNSKGRTVEQQNIDDRIKATMDPTKISWIHLIALDGKIIRRMPVRCKVSSSGKRLEPTEAMGFAGDFQRYSIPTYQGYGTKELIQPDGTYGQSDPYIYWFDPMGRYHQWGTAGGLGYLVTDYPIDLANPQDLVTGMYNADAAATAWQKQQEAKLQAAEAPTVK